MLSTAQNSPTAPPTTLEEIIMFIQDVNGSYFNLNERLGRICNKLQLIPESQAEPMNKESEPDGILSKLRKEVSYIDQKNKSLAGMVTKLEGLI